LLRFAKFVNIKNAVSFRKLFQNIRNRIKVAQGIET